MTSRRRGVTLRRISASPKLPRTSSRPGRRHLSSDGSDSNVAGMSDCPVDVGDDEACSERASRAVDEGGTKDGGNSPEESRTSSQIQLCVVCSDTASGQFFGASVCLPCKSFYIRCTKDGEPVFSNKCNGDCDVTKQSRIRCQYCRYQKCLQAGMSRREKPERIDPSEGQYLCLVCGDLANGIHFGVFTCEGCKKFFRRGLVENASYKCKENNACLINPRSRNTCRACRYRKCIDVGMSRDAIRMGRPRKKDPDLANPATQRGPSPEPEAIVIPTLDSDSSEEVEMFEIQNESSGPLPVQTSVEEVHQHVPEASTGSPTITTPTSLPSPDVSVEPLAHFPILPNMHCGSGSGSRLCMFASAAESTHNKDSFGAVPTDNNDVRKLAPNADKIISTTPEEIAVAGPSGTHGHSAPAGPSAAASTSSADAPSFYSISNDEIDSMLKWLDDFETPRSRIHSRRRVSDSCGGVCKGRKQQRLSDSDTQRQLAQVYRNPCLFVNQQESTRDECCLDECGQSTWPKSSSTRGRTRASSYDTIRGSVQIDDYQVPRLQGNLRSENVAHKLPEIGGSAQRNDFQIPGLQSDLHSENLVPELSEIDGSPQTDKFQLPVRQSDNHSENFVPELPEIGGSPQTDNFQLPGRQSDLHSENFVPELPEIGGSPQTDTFQLPGLQSDLHSENFVPELPEVSGSAQTDDFQILGLQDTSDPHSENFVARLSRIGLPFLGYQTNVDISLPQSMVEFVNDASSMYDVPVDKTINHTHIHIPINGDFSFVSSAHPNGPTTSPVPIRAEPHSCRCSTRKSKCQDMKTHAEAQLLDMGPQCPSETPCSQSVTEISNAFAVLYDKSHDRNGLPAPTKPGQRQNNHDRDLDIICQCIEEFGGLCLCQDDNKKEDDTSKDALLLASVPDWTSIFADPSINGYGPRNITLDPGPLVKSRPTNSNQTDNHSRQVKDTANHPDQANNIQQLLESYMIVLNDKTSTTTMDTRIPTSEMTSTVTKTTAILSDSQN